MDDLKKKLENIWFYYKVPIIIIGIVVVIIIDFAVTSKPKEKHDHNIAFVATHFPEEEVLYSIPGLFEKIYDGTFGLETFNIDFNSNMPDQVEVSRLDLDLGNKLSDYLIVEDIEGFKKATTNMELDVALIENIDELKGNGIDNYYLITRK